MSNYCGSSGGKGSGAERTSGNSSNPDVIPMDRAPKAVESAISNMLNSPNIPDRIKDNASRDAKILGVMEERATRPGASAADVNKYQAAATKFSNKYGKAGDVENGLKTLTRNEQTVGLNNKVMNENRANSGGRLTKGDKETERVYKAVNKQLVEESSKINKELKKRLF